MLLRNSFHSWRSGLHSNKDEFNLEILCYHIRFDAFLGFEAIGSLKEGGKSSEKRKVKEKTNLKYSTIS